MVSFESNEIASIEPYTFMKLVKLESLNLASNKIDSITKDYFKNLYSLKHLNLSNNKISLIENQSFINLYKLLVLDLSYNNLVMLENDVFKGLTDLKDLHFRTSQVFELKANSFDHLNSVNRIFLNESLLLYLNNKCLLVGPFEKDSKRNLSINNGDVLVFLKSINLISTKTVINSKKNVSLYCQITFFFLQMNIHYDLTTDFEFEDFYRSCSDLIYSNPVYKNIAKKDCNQSI